MSVSPSFSCHRWLMITMALCLLVSTDAVRCLFAQDQLGAFEHATDIGDVGKPGSVVYEEKSGTYSISGGGENMWATGDEQQVLARWSGWGAVPRIFDEDVDRFTAQRSELRQLASQL